MHLIYYIQVSVRQLRQYHKIYLVSHSQATQIEEMLSAKYTEALMEYICRIIWNNEYVSGDHDLLSNIP